MLKNYQFDNVDLQIIAHLQRDARMPFTELAKKLVVSPGTIHQRFEKLKEAGIISGSELKINYRAAGVGVTVLLGIHCQNAKSVAKVVEKLEKLDEVVEAYFTTGNYGLFIKVMSRDIDHYHQFLVKKLQTIQEIQSTESFICLDMPLQRQGDLGGIIFGQV